MNTQILTDVIQETLTPSFYDVFQIILPVITAYLTKCFLNYIFFNNKQLVNIFYHITRFFITIVCLAIAIAVFCLYQEIMLHKLESICIAISIVLIISAIKKLYFLIKDINHNKKHLSCHN